MDINDIRDKIKDIELDFDMETTWNSIQEKKETKRRGLFWFFVPATLLALIGIAFFMDSNALAPHQTSNSHGNETTTNQNQQIIDSQVYEEQTNAHVSAETFEETTEKPFVEKIQTPHKSDLNSHSSLTKHHDLDKKPSLIYTKLDADNDNKNTLNRDNSSSSQKEESLQIGDFKSSSTKGQRNYKFKTTEYYIPSVDPKINLPRLSLGFESIASLERRFLENETLMDDFQLTVDPFKNNIKRNLFFDIYGGYGSIGRKLTGSDTEYIENRNESENVLDYFEYGINTGMPITEKLAVGIGIKIIRLNEESLFTESKISNLNTIDPSALPDHLKGVEGYLISKDNYVYQNHVQHIFIPIFLKYEFLQLEYFEPYVDLEWSYAIKSKARFVRNENFEVTDYGHQIREKGSNMLRIGLGFNIPLTTNIKLNAACSYGRLSNIIQEAQSYKQTYTIYGGNLGFNVSF